MRTFNQEFTQANFTDSRKPIVVLKIENPNGDYFFTSQNVTIADAGTKFQGVITSDNGTSQQITPERGFSTIGSINIGLQDAGVTGALRTLDGLGSSLFNNRATVLAGYEGLDFANFEQIAPVMYVKDIDNGDIEYVVRLEDVQRLQKKTIFDPRPKTKVLNGIGYDSSGTITVEDTTGFELVEHDAGWIDAPSATVGYLKIKGVDPNGVDIVEYARYTSKTANSFAIDARRRLGSNLVNLRGLNDPDEDSDFNAVEVEELVYIDWSLPKMLVALLTGDLLDQVGETIPSHWNAGLDATKVDVDSIINIGTDLDAVRLQAWDLDRDDAKNFIADEILAPFNLFFKVNQQGELSLQRFSSVPQDTPVVAVLDNDSIQTVSNTSRSTKEIRNVFAINWEYRNSTESYARKDVYQDADSIAKYTNGEQSDAYELNLRLLRNSSVNNKALLDRVAEGIRARFSNPRITPSVTVNIQDAAHIEIGDIIQLQLANRPDYSNTDTLDSAFEVQGMSWDFLQGTVRLSLFGSEGTTTPIDLGDDGIPTIDHTGWTDIRTVLSGSSSGGTFTVSGGTLNTGKYYCPENLTINADITLNGSVVIDVVGTYEGNASTTINGIANGGTTGIAGFYGGGDYSQEGIAVHARIEPLKDRFKRWSRRDTNPRVPAGATSVSDLKILIDESNVLQGIPEVLTGNGGSKGDDIHPVDFILSGGEGGAAVSGGAGLCLIANVIIVNPGHLIDLSGDDANRGESLVLADGPFNTYTYYAGHSGFGWPGAFIGLVKDKTQALPIAFDLLRQQTGVSGDVSGAITPSKSGAYRTTLGIPNGTEIQCFGSFGSADKDLRQKASYIGYLSQKTEADNVVGVDPTPTPELPTITLTETVNEPLTPLGNLSTITVTATPQVGDNAYSYSEFSYRVAGQDQWVAIDYQVRSESTFTVTADGSTYEVRAQPVNVQGVKTEAFSTAQITVSKVDLQTDVGDTAPEVPRVSRLELINRLDDGDNWNKWKGPNAEFKWAKLSTTLGGDIIGIEGRLDLHFANYAVKIYDTASGNLLHETTTTDSAFVYTLEQNKKDTGGNPKRQITISVQATTDSGFASEPTFIEVENPASAAPTSVTVGYAPAGVALAWDTPTDRDFVGVLIRGKLYESTSALIDPSTDREETLTLTSVDQFGNGNSATVNLVNSAPSAVTGITATAGFNSIEVGYEAPTDFDFIGVNYRVRPTGGNYAGKALATASPLVIGGLETGTEYEIELTSVDTLGEGASTSVIQSTRVLDADEVDGLSNWAVEVDPVDAAFIAANMANNAVSSDQIASLVAGKIAAGNVQVGINLGDPNSAAIELDGATGTIKTRSDATNGVDIRPDGVVVSVNSGYETYFGPVSRPSISATPLIFHAWDGVDSPFWIDSAGNSEYGGNLSAAGGTFTGTLSAAGGTFTGDLSAAGGSFTGTLTSVDGVFTGSLSAVDGTFTGTLSGVNGDFSGEVTSTSGSIGGFGISSTAITSSGIQISNASTAFNPYGSIYLRVAGSYYAEIDNKDTYSGGYLLTTGSTYLGGLYVTDPPFLDPKTVIDTDEQVLGSSGTNYTDLPNGKRMMWGRATSVGTSYVTVNLPAAFANTAYNIVATAVSGTSYVASNPTKTTTTFQLKSSNTGGVDVDWQVIGTAP